MNKLSVDVSAQTKLNAEPLRIVIAQSDAVLAQLLKFELCYTGYQVQIAEDGAIALLMIRETNPDLVVLDWSLPRVSCLEICQRLRATQNSVSVTVLLPTGEIQSCVAALDAGADDCLFIPFPMEEFMARLRTQLRRSQKQPASICRFAEITLDQNAHQVYVNGHGVELTAKEFDLLEYLMRHPRQVVSRDQILEHVWNYEFLGTSNVIEVYIRYLRLKLEVHGAKRLIHTVRGVGYVLRDQSTAK